jgi:hypothetical protein
MKTEQDPLTRILHNAVIIAIAASSATSLTTLAEYVATGTASLVDPRLESWMINESGTLATVQLAEGEDATTSWQAIDEDWPQFDPPWIDLWEGLTGLDEQPTISAIPSDVTAVYYSSFEIYVYATGLAGYMMGPWYNDREPPDGVLEPFEFRPLDRATARLYNGTPHILKIPRSSEPAGLVVYPTGLGAIGAWVNGTSVYGPMSGFYYDESRPNKEGVGTGVWNLDAVVKERGRP